MVAMRSDAQAVRVQPGNFYVSTTGETVTTLLGSCVAACIRDSFTGVGGLNHFLLPESGERAGAPELISDAARYGTFAMESLINGILTRGGMKSRLEVKLFGGARMIESMFDVGGKNIRFARSYVLLEGLRIEAEDVGGNTPRRIYFDTSTGRVRVNRLPPVVHRAIESEERAYVAQISSRPVTGDIELFE